MIEIINDLRFAYNEWEVLKVRHAPFHAANAALIPAMLERMIAGGGAV